MNIPEHFIRRPVMTTLVMAAILAFVFNLDRAMAEGIVQPDVDVPAGARFDEEGKAIS